MKTYRSAVTILFLSAALLVGCSSGGEKTNPSVPAYTPGADNSGGTAPAESAPADDYYYSAEASASSTSATDGPLTAEGLSDPVTEYTVLSIPDDLDELQQEALRTYIAYDRATWEGYRTEDGDLSAVEATASGDALEYYKKSYDEYMSAGQHAEGSFNKSVLRVDMHDEDIRPIATITACSDFRSSRIVDSSGNDVSRDDWKVLATYSITLVRSGGTWTVTSWTRSEPGRLCTQ